MAGRKAIPIDNIDPTKHKKSKKDYLERKDATIKIGNSEFIAPDLVLSNEIALKRWNDVLELYKTSNVDIVTSADVALLERYVITYADYVKLQTMKDKLEAKTGSYSLFVQICNKNNLDTLIEKKSKLLMSMESELFLTPLSKSRAIPRKKEKSEGDNALEAAGFGGL